MLEEFSHGARCLFQGFSWLTRPGVRRYVVLPLLINLLLFAAAIALGTHYFGAWLHHWISGLPHWLAWLTAVLWVVFALAAVVVLFYAFALLANVIAAPLDIFLAMQIEARLTGRRPETGRSLAMDIVVGLRSQLQRLLYLAWRMLLIAVVGLVLLFVPLFGALTPLLWFVFTAWTLAIVYSDFPLSNRGVTFVEQRRLFRQKHARLFGFGVATALCTMVPVVNFIIMPAAVAGATLMWTESRASSS
ncbi:MAG: sulfate transporter CysZ [Gammaproteobacteria bacterium]|nr:sulfate transporter CysZ [Gammaproteobacteria bacterium]